MPGNSIFFIEHFHITGSIGYLVNISVKSENKNTEAVPWRCSKTKVFLSKTPVPELFYKRNKTQAQVFPYEFAKIVRIHFHIHLYIHRRPPGGCSLK